MMVVMSCTILVMAPIMCIGGIIMALRQDLNLSWILGISVPLLVISMGFLIARMVPGFRVMQGRLDAVNRVLREQITGIRVVRAFVREPYEVERFGDANRELTEAALGVGRLMALMFPLVMLISNVTSVAVIWFGGHQINEGSMQIGSLTAMLSYIMQILMAVMMATFMAVMLPRASVCAERISEVLDTDSSVIPPENPVLELKDPGVVELRGAQFQFPGAEEPVLRDITFRAEPGKTTAIIGGTGSGKTTLLNLIPRLIDSTSGSVSVGGVDVRDIDTELLCSVIGLVPQKPYLFSGTVATNLRYGNPEATDEWLWECLESPKLPTSSAPCQKAWTHRWHKAVRRYRAVSVRDSPSPERWCVSRRSICSTIPSRHSTSLPTQGCVRRSGRSRKTPASSLSRSVSPPSSRPIRSSCSTTAPSWGSARTTNSWSVVPPTAKSSPLS